MAVRLARDLVAHSANAQGDSGVRLQPLLLVAGLLLALFAGFVGYQLFIGFLTIDLRVTVENNPFKKQPYLHHVSANLLCAFSGSIVGAMLGVSAWGESDEAA